jgi:hypothetical protein
VVHTRLWFVGIVARVSRLMAQLHSNAFRDISPHPDTIVQKLESLGTRLWQAARLAACNSLVVSQQDALSLFDATVAVYHAVRARVA